MREGWCSTGVVKPPEGTDYAKKSTNGPVELKYIVMDGCIIVTCRGKRLSLLFDVVLLLITTGTPHSHIRACGPSAITHGMLALMHSG